MHEHFKSAWQGFEAKNSGDYVRQAHEFLHKPPPGALSNVRTVGDAVLCEYYKKSFGIMEMSGATRTLYKPDPREPGSPRGRRYQAAMDYFNAQQ